MDDKVSLFIEILDTQERFAKVSADDVGVAWFVDYFLLIFSLIMLQNMLLLDYISQDRLFLFRKIIVHFFLIELFCKIVA